MEQVVVIVGAGPSGLATSACLSAHSIPHVVLEREDVYASLWKKQTYDRLKLHLAKEFCALPFKPYSPNSPTYIPKAMFLDYLDDYVETFDIRPRYHRSVESAVYDKADGKWRIEARNTESGGVEVYVAEFLVIASGENGAKYIPDLPGLDTFQGEISHSNEYKSGAKYENKDVLVVGCGNSGMEIAYDLSNHGVRTSIVIRSPVHVVTKEIVRLGMRFSKYVPIRVVDFMTVVMSKIVLGDLSKHGIRPPKQGPFTLKATAGRAPVIDVGTIGKIKSKEIKDYEYVLNENGMPKNGFPYHWKGENNLYCCGFSRRGLFGLSMDAMAIADHINKVITEKNEQVKKKCF